MTKKKSRIKPSADTEISMWNAGYKVGFENGKKSALNHNLCLINAQLKASEKYNKDFCGDGK